MKLFRRVSFFNIFDNHKLKQLIDKLKVKEYKKG